MIEVKTDCFGYISEAKRCVVLKDTFCKNEECSFYKTKKQYKEDLKKYPMKQMN